VYGKSPWKVIASSDVCKPSNFIFEIGAPFEKRLWEKSSLSTRFVFGRMDVRISKIVGFVRISVWRNHRSVLLPKRRMALPRPSTASATDRRWATSRGLSRTIRIPTTCGSNRTALRATQRTPRWTFCARTIRGGYDYVARRRELATDIVRFNVRRRFPFGAILNRGSMQINHKQLMPSKST